MGIGRELFQGIVPALLKLLTAKNAKFSQRTPRLDDDIAREDLIMAATAAAPSKGFEWRTLLGPTHYWTIPITETRTAAEQTMSMQHCELCGEPVNDGRPFMTNSAGQFPIHILCSSGDEPVAIASRRARKTWRRWLQSLVTG